MQVPFCHGLGKKGDFTQNNSLPRTTLSIQFASVSHWGKVSVCLEPLTASVRRDLNTEITIWNRHGPHQQPNACFKKRLENAHHLWHANHTQRNWINSYGSHVSVRQKNYGMPRGMPAQPARLLLNALRFLTFLPECPLPLMTHSSEGKSICGFLSASY